MRDDIPTGARPWIGWTLTVLTLLLILFGWLLVRGMGAADALRQAERTGASLQGAIEADDARRIALFSERLTEQTASAHALTSDPVWLTAELVPGIGSGMRMLREVAEVSEQFAAEALPPLVSASAGFELGAFGLSGSTVDLAAYPGARQHLHEAADAAAATAARLAALDPASAQGPLQPAAADAHAALAAGVERIQALAVAVDIVPTILGLHDPHTILAVGIDGTRLPGSDAIGSITHLSAEGGAIDYQTTSTARGIAALADPLPADASFAEHAAFIASSWQEQHGVPVNAVVAFDVHALAGILDAVGEVRTVDAGFTASTIVKALTVDLPAEIEDTDGQNAYFARTAGAVIAAGLEARDPGALVANLAEAADAGHIVFWSAQEDEQRRLAASRLGDYPR